MRTRIVPATEITAKKGLQARKYISDAPQTKRKYGFRILVETTEDISPERLQDIMSRELVDVLAFKGLYTDDSHEKLVPAKIVLEKVRRLKI